MSQYESGFGAPIDPMDESLEVSLEPAGWPTPIGVISIVLASLGLLCYGCQSGATIMNPMFMGMIPEDQRPPSPSTALYATQIVQLCGSFLLSCWLLAAGIGLCKRRPWAPRGCVAWSWIKIIFSLIGAGLSLFFVGESVQQINDGMTQQGSTPPFTMTVPLLMVILAAMTLLVLVWPAFLLVWFARGSVKQEVARWGDPSFGLDDDLGA